MIFIGDRISKNSKITVGGDAITKIRQITADICFLGINAIDAENGLTDNDWDVVQVKKAMIEASKKVVALTISEKINSVQKIKIAAIDELDILVTDEDPSVLFSMHIERREYRYYRIIYYYRTSPKR